MYGGSGVDRELRVQIAQVSVERVRGAQPAAQSATAGRGCPLRTLMSGWSSMAFTVLWVPCTTFSTPLGSPGVGQVGRELG